MLHFKNKQQRKKLKTRKQTLLYVHRNSTKFMQTQHAAADFGKRPNAVQPVLMERSICPKHDKWAISGSMQQHLKWHWISLHECSIGRLRSIGSMKFKIKSNIAAETSTSDHNDMIWTRATQWNVWTAVTENRWNWDRTATTRGCWKDRNHIENHTS